MVVRGVSCVGETIHTHPVDELAGSFRRMRRKTYNCYFPTKLVFDITFFECIWAFLSNDLKEIFDTHGCGIREVFWLLVWYGYGRNVLQRLERTLDDAKYFATALKRDLAPRLLCSS